MLSPADLVEMAEQFASRIPDGPEYSEEREISWQLVGEAFLRMNDAVGAARALRRFKDVGFEAEFRFLLAEWAAAHPHSQVGRDLLRETVDDIARWELHIGGSEYGDLILIVRDILGEVEARKLTARLPEVLDWTNLSPSELRQQAYQGRELFETPTHLDSAELQLARYLHYRHNDLKVRWLVQRAAEGGLVDPLLVARLAEDAFQRVERARQPSVNADIGLFSQEEFTAFLFDRPVPIEDRDEQLLKGRHFDWVQHDAEFIIEHATSLFRDFARRVAPYSAAQVDQGLWILFGYALSLGSILERAEVSAEQRTACLEAMDVPFRDYLRKRPRYRGTAFFMWWDLIRMTESDLAKVALRVIEKIMHLPGWPCQAAALHGLNHLRPDPEASALVAKYLNENRTRLKAKELAWVEQCRDGKAL